MDDPPTLTIAAENSEKELRKQRVIDQLEWPTREMTANLFRVMRGAGRPHELPQQIVNLSCAILDANELSNAWGIWSKIEEVLMWQPGAEPGPALEGTPDDPRFKYLKYD